MLYEVITIEFTTPAIKIPVIRIDKISRTLNDIASIAARIKADPVPAASKSVITSYSIHYTKLYDIQLAFFLKIGK